MLSVPLVSVVVAVRGRPDDLAVTLAAIGAQALPDPEMTIEVLVIDGSDEPAPIPAADGVPVRTIRAASPGLGAARAAALAAASGVVLAACDAGDVWTPACLATLVPPLLADPHPVLVGAIHVDEPAGFTPTETDPRPLLRELPPCAVVIRTAAARAVGGYAPALAAAADYDLWLRLSQTGAVSLVAAPVPIATVARPTREDDAARAADLAHLERLDSRRRDVATVGGRFVERRAGAPLEPFNPATWDTAAGGRRELIWHSQLRRTKSFGLVGRRLLLAVERQGITPLLTPFSGEAPTDLGRFVATPARWDRLAFLADPLVPPGALRVERLVRNATWETTEIPRWEVDAINRHVALLCVPCRQNRDDAHAAGVRVPVMILPYGIESADFPLLDRPERNPFTVGTFGELSPRKGVDVLLRAFRAAFRPTDPVRLLVKGVKREPEALFPDWARQDPRIVYRGGRLDGADLLALLGEMDACVLPTRGEAFGLCGLEAMATGLPLIATNWSGPADYLDPADSLPLGFRLVDAAGVESNEMRYFGRWAEPDEGHLVELLRWVFENRDAAAAMGHAAADRVQAGWTWDHAAIRLRDALDALAAGVSPA